MYSVLLRTQSVTQSVFSESVCLGERVCESLGGGRMLVEC